MNAKIKRTRKNCLPFQYLRKLVLGKSGIQCGLENPTLEGGVAIQKSHFCGVAKIVVCHNTPITISYYTKTQKCSTTFWIQRYNQDMMAMDALVQAKMNE